MKLAPIFNHHMVFPANKPILVYGEAVGAVTIRFAEFEQTVSPKNGRFIALFRPLPYGGPHILSAEGDGEEIVLFDIHIGEVFLFAGQSNMQYKLRESGLYRDIYENNSALRLYSTYRMQPDEPYTPKDGWLTAKADMLDNWPAIPYLTARRFSEQNPGIAVGLIGCYQGASVIESWVPRGAFEAAGIHVPPESKHIDHTVEPFCQWNGDGTLYEFALSQVRPFPISGVVWYQGESDTTSAEAAVYADELRTMISIWRSDFADPNRPFVIVQIADYMAPYEQAGWEALQAAQASMSGTDRFVSVVVSSDVCEDWDIHPKSKAALSERIADALDSLLS